MYSWDEWYLQAKKYYCKHGNLNISTSYVDDDGFNLGRWICAQRAKYKGNDSHGTVLSADKIQKLEMIGMIWDSLEASWNEYYSSACQYYGQNGNLLVPATYIDSNGLKLGQWISKQRAYYLGKAKRGRITKERIRKLELIGMRWTPMEDQWEKSYAAAYDFFQNSGHLMVPKDYVSDDGIKLNNWIGSQRSKYHHKGGGELTKEQISRLEKIGMQWTPNDEEWMNNFIHAKAYYERMGDLLVPERYYTEEDGNLGAWICRQRERMSGYRGKKLSSRQIELLNSIGMEWNPYQAQFENCFLEAKDYYFNVGDLEIENSFVSASGLKLGLWIANLRKAYNNNELSENIINRLEGIGMIWEVKNNPTQTSYPEQVILYYVRKLFPLTQNRFNDLGFELDIYIPNYNIGIEYDGVAWHKSKKENDNKKNNLCQEQGVELYRFREAGCPSLNGISTDISVGKYSIQNVLDACTKLFEIFFQKKYISHIPSLDYYEDIAEIRKVYRNAKNEAWDIMYREAKDYYKNHGNLRIPYNYVTNNGYQLGTWITNQRSNYAGYSGTGIDEQRVAMLEKIGMVWSVPDSQWQMGYDEAKRYYEKHGNIDVNAKFVSDTGYKLGIWIRTQRKNKCLSKEQKALLEKIGMTWSVFDNKWERGIVEAKKYFSLNGNLKVPAKYVTDLGFPLGNWIATQRSRYYHKNGEKALSSEQVSKLEELGMIWDVLIEAWNEGFEHARWYYDKNGDLLVPVDYVCDDGYALGGWIQTRRGGYKGTGSWAKPTDEQVRLLEEIGMIWDIEDYLWKKNYSLAKDYYNKNGNLNVVKRYITPSGEKLGLWIQRQRRAYLGKTGKSLSDERINLLNEIGMFWGE